MAARAISSATVSFGLVSIPVKLYTPTDSSGQISFNMLHQCGSRLKQQYWCPKDEKVVPRDEIVKGYEFAKGQYVTFTPQELKALEAESSGMIEIREFVPLDRVDPIYFDRAYYLGPDKGGDKPYKLLSEAMQKTGRCAVASYPARGKQYLVLLRPFQGGLVMEQLLYSEQLRSFDDVERVDASLTKSELDLAVQLIEQIASDEFRPEEYSNEVKARIEELIARKVEGEEITFAETEEPEGKIIDLMEALKASLQGGDAPAKGPKRAAGSKRSSSSKPARKKAGSRR